MSSIRSRSTPTEPGMLVRLLFHCNKDLHSLLLFTSKNCYFLQKMGTSSRQTNKQAFRSSDIWKKEVLTQWGSFIRYACQLHHYVKPQQQLYCLHTGISTCLQQYQLMFVLAVLHERWESWQSPLCSVAEMQQASLFCEGSNKKKVKFYQAKMTVW